MCTGLLPPGANPIAVKILIIIIIIIISEQSLQSTQNINLMFSHLIIGSARIYSSILPFAFLTMHDRAAKVHGSVNCLLIQVA